MATIVSAFFATGNVNRSLDVYMALGQRLIDVKVNKVIFVSEDVAKELRTNSFTKLVVMQYDFGCDSNRYELPCARNVQKDTFNYMKLMNEKTKFVKRAAEENWFCAKDFVWLDFGILHVCDKTTFESDVVALSQKSYEKIRIASIWSLENIVFSKDEVQWYFAGGCFGGSKENVLLFDKYCNQVLERIKPNIVWEVNVWAVVYAKHRYLFDPYKCDHNTSLIQSF